MSNSRSTHRGSQPSGDTGHRLLAGAAEVIAEVGYAEASLSRIAQAAGTVKGVVGYHFAGRDGLIDSFVDQALGSGEEELRQRIRKAPDGLASKMRAWIEHTVDWMGTHRQEALALIEVRRAVEARRRKKLDGSLLVGSAPWCQALEIFQRRGELVPDLDPAIAAEAIRAALDATAYTLAANHRADAGHYGSQLADLFVRATGGASGETSRRDQAVVRGDGTTSPRTPSQAADRGAARPAIRRLGRLTEAPWEGG